MMEVLFDMGKSTSFDYGALNSWKRKYSGTDIQVVDEWTKLKNLCRFLRIAMELDD